MVVDKGQVGFLSEVRKNSATFTPLPVKPEQEKRAILYITMSETYQQLYHYEAETHEENADMREHLNEYYDEFVERYGNLNEKANVKFILMDANGVTRWHLNGRKRSVCQGRHFRSSCFIRH